MDSEIIHLMTSVQQSSSLSRINNNEHEQLIEVVRSVWIDSYWAKCKKRCWETQQKRKRSRYSSWQNACRHIKIKSVHILQSIHRCEVSPLQLKACLVNDNTDILPLCGNLWKYYTSQRGKTNLSCLIYTQKEQIFSLLYKMLKH
jgi:hypothetical protein